MKLQKAERHQVKLRIGLSGPSGFGKTYSSLLLAYGITGDWNKIAIIDTENRSASLYSHLGNFNVLSLDEPYTPERYLEAIKLCEDSEMDVIIVDSISHEWQSKGGCLEIHEKLGGRFQDWSKVTPRHNSFIDAIIQSKCHVITTSRRKVDYSLDKDGEGKTKVMKQSEIVSFYKMKQ
ncbi:MAG: AAA family ATPase [Flavobacterium sp.]